MPDDVAQALCVVVGPPGGRLDREPRVDHVGAVAVTGARRRAERVGQIGLAVLAVLTIVTWTRPTGLVILLIAVVALLAAGGVRLVAQVGHQAEPGAFEAFDASASAPDDRQADDADTVDA